MSAVQISPPYQVFTDLNGEPLEAGNIYIGAANLNPETNPIPVFFDVGLTVPAAQPVRTIAGYPSRNGTPSRLYTGSADYSIAVRNKSGVFVFSAITSGGSAPAFSSIADLRALVRASDTNNIFVTGYYSPGDGGGGDYWYDSSDTTSADNGGTIIVAADGARWKLSTPYAVTVRQFGAKGDTPTTDDTVAIQAAQDWLESQGGGELYFPAAPAGGYKTTSPITVKTQRITWRGAGRKSRILNQVSDLLRIGTTSQDIFDFNLSKMHMQATAGHVITLGTGCFWSVSSVVDCFLLSGTSTSCIRYVGTTGGLIDVRFEGGEIAQPANSTASIIYVEGSVNVCSANQWLRIRFQTNGNPSLPCVQLICTGAGQFLFNNQFLHCNFEVPNAGCIKVQGGNGTVVDASAAFDVTTTTGNLWEFGQHATGVSCRNTVLNSVNRFGGALGVGLYDVYLQAALHTTMTACEGTATSGINHNLNNQQVLIQSPGAATLTNRNNTNSVLVNPTGTSFFPDLTVAGPLAHTGTTAGFYGATPVTQPLAQANTTGAALAVVEAELNSIKQKLRNLGLMAT